MVDTEHFIVNLRSQVRHLESLLNYLESREAVGREDYAFSRGKLREVVRELEALQRRSGELAMRAPLQDVWLN